MKCFRCDRWPCECKDGQTIVCGDCREILPQLPPVDLVLTDPPYPTAHVERFRYSESLLHVLEGVQCRQFIFWTPAAPFPLSFSAMRVWDKATGSHTQFELIYERGYASGYQVHRYATPHSSVRAAIVGDECLDHPSQKPVQLIRRLFADVQAFQTVDPFMGSGTTLVAAKQLGRKAIGIELEERYCEVAARRLEQGILPFPEETPPTQRQASFA